MATSTTEVRPGSAQTSLNGLKGGPQAFAAAVNAGDIETVIDRYEENAVFVAESGKPVVGKAAIREVWLEFMALKPHFQLHPRTMHRTGDLALITFDWSIDGTGAGGDPVSLKGQAVVVLREQPDGGWRLVFDNASPFQ